MNYIDNWLILAQSYQLAVRHRDVIPAHMKILGLRLNAKKSVLSLLQRTAFLGMIWDSTSMQARLSPAHIESILSRRCLRALVMWKKPWFLSQGPMLGASCRRKKLNDRCLPHGLGSDLRGMLESRSVEGPSSLMAHQPSGDVGCISCSQELLSRSQGPPCACLLRQHIGGLLHKSPGGFVVTSTLQTGMPNPPVLPREVVVSASNLHPWGPQYRSRHPVETGAEARGMEAPPWGCGADMEGVRPGISGSVYISRDVSLSALVLPHASSSSRTGCDEIDMDEASSVCISPDRSGPRSTGDSSPGPTTSYFPTVAGQSMVPRFNIPSWRASSGAPRQEGPSFPRGGLDI